MPLPGRIHLSQGGRWWSRSGRVGPVGVGQVVRQYALRPPVKGDVVHHVRQHDRTVCDRYQRHSPYFARRDVQRLGQFGPQLGDRRISGRFLGE